jgi:3-Oxoacyl-[acyl-carrier-protein (ACP)] synthase III C terminal
MDGVKVAEVFPPLMARNFQMLQEDWPAKIKPVTGTDFDIGSVARWYLHQANGVVVRQAVEMLGLPPERVPIGVDHCGNTSAASTLTCWTRTAEGPGSATVISSPSCGSAPATEP